MKPIDFATRQVSRFKNPPQGEQELVRDFFAHRQTGFYVDVGANEPVVESQTYHLEQLGWDGLMVEPHPYYFDLLESQRRGRVVRYACSSPENQNKKLRLISAGGHSTLNSKPIAIGDHSEETVEVNCRTLDSILDEYNVPVGFDFMSIDIEGHEMEMFKGFTLAKWRPQLVLLEDHVLDHRKHGFMRANGYQIILRTGLNSWYVPDTEPYALALACRLEMFRKYWLGLPFRKLKYMK